MARVPFESRGAFRAFIDPPYASPAA